MISRRVFMKATGAAVACACVGAAGCGTKPTSNTPVAPEGSYRVEDREVVLDLSMATALKAVGGAVKFSVRSHDDPELKLIVLRVADGDYRAFADHCTHNGKELNYEHGEGKLACCGLGSEFDLSGAVLEPPAEEALRSYQVRRQGNALLVAL
jgi:nitrite reductase/ring-hydroxylating ferredoxin subunit